MLSAAQLHIVPCALISFEDDMLISFDVPQAVQWPTLNDRDLLVPSLPPVIFTGLSYSTSAISLPG